LAWPVQRWLRVSAAGVAAAAVSIALLTGAGSILSRSEGDPFAFLPSFALLLAALASLGVACVIFVVCACRWQRDRRRNAIAAVAVPLAIVLLSPAVGLILGEARRLRVARQFRENQPVLQGLIDEVEAVSRRLRRVPESEKELVKLRGQPMPSIPWPSWGCHTVHYQAIGTQRFLLHFGIDYSVGTDACMYYVYDGGAPERGWRCVSSTRPPSDAPSAASQALVDEVQSIAARQGRVPSSEQDLVNLRGRPMPTVALPNWGDFKLRYRAMSAERFALYSGGVNIPGGYCVYDSGAPERGWHWDNWTHWENPLAAETPAAQWRVFP
jgi:hypothetical protein